MACRKWWPPEAPGARQPGTPGPRATADPWQFADGHALGTSGGGRACGDGKTMGNLWVYWDLMEISPWFPAFNMVFSWENILRSYGGVFCFFAKHIVEHLGFNVRFNSDFCEKSSSLMMVKKWVFIMNLRILNGNLPCVEVVNSNWSGWCCNQKRFSTS